MHPLLLIPSRLAATRLPEKPLAEIAGKPMIVHVWQRAIQADIGPVYVACDSEKIADVITQAGGKAILTRNDHASGSDRIHEALLKIDSEGNYDVIVNLQGDMPTLDPQIVRHVLAPLKIEAKNDISTLAAKITSEAERNDPAVVKPVIAFSQNHDNLALGQALYFSRATLPYGEGEHYHHIGIYAYRRPALERFVSLPPSALEKREKLEQLRALEAGMRIGIAVIDTVPLGVDTPEHLEQARRILS